MLKCAKIDFGWGSAKTPLWELIGSLQRSLRHPSWSKGDLLLREGEGCRESEGRRRYGRRGGEGSKGYPMCIYKFSIE